MLWRTGVSALSLHFYSLYRFYASSLFIFSCFIFIIIVIGICFGIMSLRCARVKKWKCFICLPFFLFISDNSFGHTCRLSKWTVCALWQSEPTLPTHYVGDSSACLLVWPRIMGTMLNGSSVWHHPCPLPDFRDKNLRILFQPE